MGNALALNEPMQLWRGALNPAHPNVYTDGRLFREEQDKVFSGCWLPACHESEIPNAYDYCTFSHPAGRYVFVIRGRDRKVRSFYNLCPRHGTSLLPGPSGNARRIACGVSSKSATTIASTSPACWKLLGKRAQPRE